MIINNEPLAPGAFLRFISQKKYTIFINWIYNKHETDWMEINKAQLKRFLKGKKITGIQSSYHKDYPFTLYIDSLDF